MIVGLQERRVRRNQVPDEAPVWKQVFEWRATPVKLLFLFAGIPDCPVQEISGRILYVRESAVGISLDGPMPVGVCPKTRFAVQVLTEEGMVLFRSVPVEGEPFGGGLIVLQMPDELHRVQRRRHCRVPVRMPVRLFVLGTELGAGTSLDLSAGGIRLVSGDLYLRQGQSAHLSFRTPDGELHHLLPGKVIRVAMEGRVRSFAIQFTEMLSQDRNALYGSVERIRAVLER
jgi:hypothetical protein